MVNENDHQHDSISIDINRNQKKLKGGSSVLACDRAADWLRETHD